MIEKSIDSSEKFKKTLIELFHECEDIISTLNLDEFKKGALRYEILDEDGYRTLRSNILDIIIWYNIYSEINKQLKIQKTLQKAVDAVITVFDNIQDNDDPISSKYSDFIKQFLIFYYLDFKKAEEKCNISISRYLHNFVENIYSENLITYQFGPILGIKIKDPEIIIGPFILYHPDDSFLTLIINDRNHNEKKYLSANDICFCPQNCLDTIWLKRKKISRKAITEKRFRSPQKSFGCLLFEDKIDDDIWKGSSSFQVGKSNFSCPNLK